MAKCTIDYNTEDETKPCVLLELTPDELVALRAVLGAVGHRIIRESMCSNSFAHITSNNPGYYEKLLTFNVYDSIHPICRQLFRPMGGD